MNTIPQQPTAPPLVDLLKRDIAMHRAAQTLADATRCHQGQSPVPLSRMDPLEREWFKQAARNVVEIFERVTEPDRESDADREQREMREVTEQREYDSLIAAARARASAAARQRGHDLGPWHCPGTELGQGRERAECRTCGRTVFIDAFSAPLYSGMAVVAGCLSVATERPE
jgi:hypothetical protein